ncbi:YhcN/YlaJ family sporulation lipoprotein [Peribacillus sp. SCS-37]|uniref:YhcN/YlaJ family sporulation lipoprotein n=1 Tax=Paraperibacillus esterisolvens TaxID=3115296 RepID=UPI003905B539
MKKGTLILSSLLVLSGLAGCGNNDNDNASPKIRNNGGTKIRTDMNKDHHLRTENKIEGKVEDLNYVDDAHVIVSGNDAYVAVRKHDRDRDGVNNNMTGNRDGADIDNNIGTDRMGTYGGTGTGNRMGDNAGDLNGRDNGNEDSADNDGARTYSKVDSKREQEIADRVRAADKSIHKVYVSFDEDVFGRFGDFDNNILDGNNNNDDGLFNNFNTYVRRVFNR